MGRFAPKYSENQKEAVICAVLEDRLSAPRVAELARQGKLPGCRAFEIPTGTIRHYVKVARRKRRRGDAADPAQRPAMLENAEQQLMGVLLDRVYRITRTPDRYSTSEIRTTIRALRELGVPAIKRGEGTKNARSDSTATPSIAEQLARKLAASPALNEDKDTTDSGQSAYANVSVLGEPIDVEAAQQRVAERDRLSAHVQTTQPAGSQEPDPPELAA